MGVGCESGRRVEGIERVDNARDDSLVRGPALYTVGRKLPARRGNSIAGPGAAQVRLGLSTAVLLERGCRHARMRLHYVRKHVFLRLSANLLDAMGGRIAAVCVGSGSQPQSSQPVQSSSRLARSSYARLVWESMSRAREGGSMRGDWFVCRAQYQQCIEALPCVGEGVLKIVELHASLS
jgi:hypothetical protein